jgi:hypothetical protein
MKWCASGGAFEVYMYEIDNYVSVDTPFEKQLRSELGRRLVQELNYRKEDEWCGL